MRWRVRYCAVASARARHRRGRVSALGLALACAFGALPGRAQPPLPRGVPFGPFERPGEIRPEVPPPEAPPTPQFTLPPLPTPGTDELQLSRQPSVVVREV